MADDKAAAGGDEKKEAEVPAGPKIILGLPLPQFLFVAVNLLVMLGGLGYIIQVSLLYKKPAITDEQVVAEVQKKETKLKELVGDGFFVESYPEMTVTLRSQSGGKAHFATVEISLVCGAETCLNQVKANKAKIEDAIQTVLGSRSYTELGSLEVKFRVKHEIMERVNSLLSDTAVLDVLFPAFLVQ